MTRMKAWLLALFVAACTPTAPVSAPAAPPKPVPAPSASETDWRQEVPKPGPAARFWYPTPQSAKLANGLTLLVVQRPTRVSTLAFVVRAGASSVDKGKSGLAALTARMLTEGTKKHSSASLAEAAESLGSTLDHDAGRDYSSIGLTTLNEFVPRGIALVAEVVREPAFSAVEFQRVQKEWIDGLVAERQTPERLASLAGLRLLLGEPAGAPVGGSIADVKKLGVKDLVAFHAAHYTPGESALIVVGNVTLESVQPQVEKVFADWKSGPVAPLGAIPTPAPAANVVHLVDRPGSVQSALFVAQPLPKRSEDGHEVRLVLNNLLGGLFTSRLNHNLREVHAYTYGARSSDVATRQWGALVVTTSVQTPSTADALFELIGELRKARDPALGAPIQTDEVERARTDLETGLAAHLEDDDRVADDFSTSFVDGLPLDYLAHFDTALAKATRDSVASEAKARLDPDHLVIVVVGDRASVGADLQKKGFQLETASDALIE
jgi:zinc protease